MGKHKIDWTPIILLGGLAVIAYVAIRNIQGKGVVSGVTEVASGATTGIQRASTGISQGLRQGGSILGLLGYTLFGIAPFGPFLGGLGGLTTEQFVEQETQKYEANAKDRELTLDSPIVKTVFPKQPTATGAVGPQIGVLTAFKQAYPKAFKDIIAPAVGAEVKQEIVKTAFGGSQLGKKILGAWS
jgi:hypothetical protein